MVYGGDGNRVSETVGGVRTKYLVADQNLTGYAQVIAEFQNGTVSRAYSYGLTLISQRLGASGSQLCFYGFDGHGSVRFLTDSTGAVTDTYDYDAFGNLISQTGTTPNNYLFAGEQFDPALGVYYNRARYYDQRQGRFWTMDTWEGSRFGPKSLHRYLYASANPVDRVDPTGYAEATLTGQAVTLSNLITLSLLTVVTLEYECLAFAQPQLGSVGPCAGRKGPKKQGRMRIQLQLADVFTVPGTPVLVNDDPPGVTSLQVREGLMDIYVIAQSALALFPFNSLESELVSAVISVSIQAGQFVPLGYSGFRRSLLTAPVGGSGWRIDVDNLEGTNLRE